MQTFSDWFSTQALPHLKKLKGKKVLIGDNLSSHLSAEVIQKCEENEIAFCFLPPNSTHKLQPLDVSFFHPLKTAWRKILLSRKRACRNKASSFTKDMFPLLLSKLHKDISKNAASNIKAGFLKCGLSPLNKEKVLACLPNERCSVSAGTVEESAAAIDDSLVSLLGEMRYGDTGKKKAKRRKVDIEPGKSVGSSDLPQASTTPIPVVTSCNSHQDDVDLNQPTDHDEDSSSESQKEGGDIDVSQLKSGDFVIFNYEGELFPGQVSEVKEDGCNIKSLVKSGVDWKWPKHEDLMFYSLCDIITKINCPKEKKRGILAVPELADKWGAL